MDWVTKKDPMHMITPFIPPLCLYETEHIFWTDTAASRKKLREAQAIHQSAEKLAIIYLHRKRQTKVSSSEVK